MNHLHIRIGGIEQLPERSQQWQESLIFKTCVELQGFGSRWGGAMLLKTKANAGVRLLGISTTSV
ncbi:MAG: hypothetical protein HC866_14395 [Leptolyngbyaceae cyanobacterium RU_5_1]|nr:hypothetical protein [Leptolyngbyaceae cyanobacterium RU_5_1]